MCARARACACACACACTCVCARACVRECVRACMRVHVRVHVRVCVPMNVYYEGSVCEPYNLRQRSREYEISFHISQLHAIFRIHY